MGINLLKLWATYYFDVLAKFTTQLYFVEFFF